MKIPEKPLEPDALALLCARTMESNDNVSKYLGIRIVSAKQDRAIVEMTVTGNTTNGHQTCHGGAIFSLADTCFAYACNSENQAAVAASCTIDFIRPALIGDTLRATTMVQYQGQKTGVYETLITNQDDKLVAIFKGRSARIGRSVVNI